MIPEHERLVRETLPRLEAHGQEAAACFYARLFALDPTAAELFADVDMQQQGEKFVTMLAYLVRALDAAPTFVSNVAALGRRHAHLQTTTEHYAAAGAALVGTVEHLLGDDATAEVLEAWTEAYALVAAVMQRAVAHSGAGRTP